MSDCPTGILGFGATEEDEPSGPETPPYCYMVECEFVLHLRHK
jgi:hypothetical protein